MSIKTSFLNHSPRMVKFEYFSCKRDFITDNVCELPVCRHSNRRLIFQHHPILIFNDFLV